jgi:hypothetical protein
MQKEKGEAMVPFPNSSSLAAEPFIFNTHSSMPSSYNHPLQESLVQHFPTAHIDDLEERANQLMAARHAHTKPPHTHAPHQSCEYCYHPSHGFDDCPFFIHYVIEANKSTHEHTQITITLVSEEKAFNKEEEKEEHLEQIDTPPNPNRSNNKEVSTEAHSFITIPLRHNLNHKFHLSNVSKSRLI